MPPPSEEDPEAQPRQQDASVGVRDNQQRAPSGCPPQRNKDASRLLLEEKLSINHPLESTAARNARNARTARTAVEGASRLQAEATSSRNERGGNRLILEEKLSLNHPFASTAARNSRNVESATSSRNERSLGGNRLILEEKLSILHPPTLGAGAGVYVESGSMARVSSAGSPSATASQLILEEKIAIHQTPMSGPVSVPTAVEPRANSSEIVDVDTSSSIQTIGGNAPQDATTTCQGLIHREGVVVMDTSEETDIYRPDSPIESRSSSEMEALGPSDAQFADLENPPASAEETDMYRPDLPIESRSSGEMEPRGPNEAAEDRAQSHQDWDASTSNATEDIVLSNALGPPIAIPVHPHFHIQSALLVQSVVLENDKDVQGNILGFQMLSRRHCVAACAVVALIVINLLAWFTYNLLNSDSPTPTDEPTMATAVTDRPALIQLLTPISSPDAFATNSTPQYKALDWMDTMDSTFSDRTQNSETAIRERYAALVLYFATQGDRWNNAYGFVDNQTSICDWNSGEGSNSLGIVCNEFNRVTNLDLQENNLNGSIPIEMQAWEVLGFVSLQNNALTGTLSPELFSSWTRMRQLNLANNAKITGPMPTEMGLMVQLYAMTFSGVNLRGTIPSEFGNLRAVTDWWSGGTNISGTLPTELGGMTSLQRLSLSANDLTGTIPSELGLWVDLEQLFFGKNRMNGTLPTEAGFWTGLTVMAFENNDLTGSIPTELGQLTALEQMWLNGCAFTGPLPLMGNWRQLQHLSFANCAMTGTIPTEIGALTRMQSAYLYSNKFTGTVPSEIGLLSNRLDKFLLSENDLTGTIPTEIGNAIGISEFWLAGNRLNGTFPSEIGNMQKLKILGLSMNQLTGIIPTEIGNAIGISEFWLAGNRINGTVPSEIGNMQKLNALDLNKNQLTGTIPSEIGLLSQLQNLLLFENSFTGTLPSGIGAATLLWELNLSENSFSGTFPLEYAALSRLRTFAFNDNRLNGTIPMNILQDLTMLQDLRLSGNGFTGTLPSELALMTTLRRLSLGTNGFVGSMPSELGRLANLEQLVLSENALTGNIPPQYASLSLLTGCFFSSTRLNGTIPMEILSNLRLLESLDLSLNNLTGALPTGLGLLTNLRRLALWSNRLKGAVPSELGKLAALEELNLSDNLFSGMLPTELGTLAPQLGLVHLQNNAFVGSLDSVFCDSIAAAVGGGVENNPDFMQQLVADCGETVDVTDINTTIAPELNCSCCTTCCPGGSDTLCVAMV